MFRRSANIGSADGERLRVQREVCGVFLDAELPWAEYARTIKQLTKTPLQGMSLLQHQSAAAAGVTGGQAPVGGASGEEDRVRQEQQYVL